MSEIPLDVLTRAFDPGQVKQREGRGGKQLDYLETHAVITRLNEAFKGAWSFEIIDYKTMEGEVVVQGRLSANGQLKSQFGSSEVSRYASGDREGKPICIGDDLKAAASDCLKKCATLFGVGLELYGKAVVESRKIAKTGEGGASDRQIEFIKKLLHAAILSSGALASIEAELQNGMTRERASALIEELRRVGRDNGQVQGRGNGRAGGRE